MTKFCTLLALLTVGNCEGIALASYETGAANQVLRVPGAGGRPKYGAVDVSQAAAVTGTLPHGKGGTDVASAGSAGNELVSDGTNWTSAAVTGSQMLRNVGVATSVGSSALTIAIKQSDGSTNCAATAPCITSFRSGTVTSGAYNARSVTGALSVVVSSGSTLGMVSGLAGFIYVYEIDNAGTVEAAVSSSLFDDGSVVSTTAEGGAGAADSYSAMYSTTARSNVPSRLAARIAISEATAGTWASNATEVALAPFNKPVTRISYNGTPSGTLNGSTNIITFGTKVYDPNGLYASGVFTSPIAGVCVGSATFAISATASSTSDADGIFVFKNGSVFKTYVNRRWASGAVGNSTSVNFQMNVAVADTIDIRSSTSASSPSYVTTDATYNTLGIVCFPTP